MRTSENWGFCMILSFIQSGPDLWMIMFSCTVSAYAERMLHSEWPKSVDMAVWNFLKCPCSGISGWWQIDFRWKDVVIGSPCNSSSKNPMSSLSSWRWPISMKAMSWMSVWEACLVVFFFLLPAVLHGIWLSGFHLYSLSNMTIPSGKACSPLEKSCCQCEAIAFGPLRVDEHQFKKDHDLIDQIFKWNYTCIS